MRLLLIVFIPLLVLALEVIIDPYADIYDYDAITVYNLKEEVEDCYCPPEEKDDFDLIFKTLGI